MWKATKEQAEATKKFYEARLSFPFVIRPVPGNRGFEINAIRNCSRCGQEMEQGNGFDKSAICEICDRKRRMANLEATWEDGEQRREEYRQSLDFEEVCQ